jgi:nitroreductase
MSAGFTFPDNLCKSSRVLERIREGGRCQGQLRGRPGHEKYRHKSRASKQHSPGILHLKIDNRAATSAIGPRIGHFYVDDPEAALTSLKGLRPGEQRRQGRQQAPLSVCTAGFDTHQGALRQAIPFVDDHSFRRGFVEKGEMDISEAISGRRSVREYTPKAVDQKTIHHLIDAAIKAPNAVNQQPWSFTVVRDQGALDRISHAAKSHMLSTMPATSHSDHFRSLLSNPDFQIFYHAPVLILISATAQGPWIVEDCALAAENLMLAAYAAGLGTCWIGFAQSFLNTPDGKKELALHDTCVPVAPVIVGHPKAAPPPVPRREPEIRWIG